MNINEIEKFLPRYLSDEDQKQLFLQLKGFPKNINELYSSSVNFDNGILQADIVDNIPFVNLPNIEIKYTRVLVLSNSCDIELSNSRDISPSVSYVPVVTLKNLESLLIKSKVDGGRIKEIINNIKNQKITTMFYLPKGANLEDESVALFERTLHCNRDYFFKLAKEDDRIKIASLGNYGFYMFLLKLSIHYNRIHEGINRH